MPEIHILELATNDDWILTVRIWIPALIFGLLALFAALSILKFARSRSSFEIVSVTVPFGPGGTITLKRTHDVVRLAHEAWVEIVTRKAGATFDRDNDVIVEVYDSHYALFTELRKIARSVPAEALAASADSQRLVDILIDAVNEGLRPHLTEWQARFRTWYNVQREMSIGEAPQDIQRRFRQYSMLVDDLMEVQRKMSQFADAVHDIVSGEESSNGS